MMIRKLDNTQPGRRKEHRSSDSTEQNDNHTEETQHGSSQSSPNIGVRQENGKKLNKRIQWSREEIKEVLWCFTTIRKHINYGQREEPNDENEYRCKSNIKTKKNSILKAKRIMAVETDEIKENIRLKIGDATEDYTNEVNGDKMDTNVIEHQKRD